jgi:hypothetical protein
MSKYRVKTFNAEGGLDEECIECDDCFVNDDGSLVLLAHDDEGSMKNAVAIYNEGAWHSVREVKP